VGWVGVGWGVCVGGVVGVFVGGGGCSYPIIDRQWPPWPLLRILDQQLDCATYELRLDYCHWTTAKVLCIVAQCIPFKQGTRVELTGHLTLTGSLTSISRCQ